MKIIFKTILCNGIKSPSKQLKFLKYTHFISKFYTQDRDEGYDLKKDILVVYIKVTEIIDNVSIMLTSQRILMVLKKKNFL